MRRGRSLAFRFVASLLGLAILSVLAFGVLVARRAGNEVKTSSREILEESSRELSGELDRMADTQAELLDRSVRELSERFGRELEDIPFEIYEGREDRLRELLVERLGEMRERNRENAGVVAELFREREGERMDAALAGLDRRQGEEIDRFGRGVARSMLVLGGLFLLGVSALIAGVFFVQVLRPLRSAAEVMESIRGGDLGRRLEVEGADEIQRLAASFNGMADAVEASQRELEGRVEEKTGALRRSLDEQRATNATLARTQEQLVESAKMAAVGTLAQGMAHEFNNVLGGIAGCAEDLLADETDAERREVLDVILRSARRATVVTRNLKSFSRGSEAEHGPVDLGEIARATLRLVEPEAQRRGVALVAAEGLRDLPPLVSDGPGLQQIVLNLVLNAVQAGKAGGEVRLSARGLEDGETVEVAVEDDGRGIAPEYLRRIFEPFFTTKTAEGGTGLGLAVSHGIARSLGGEIRAESAGEGCGSRFVLTLPRGGVR